MYHCPTGGQVQLAGVHRRGSLRRPDSGMANPAWGGYRPDAAYRQGGNHLLLCPGGDAGILPVSSMDLGEEPCRFAHQRAIRTIRQQGGCISFAPCYHQALWDSSAAWQAAMRSFLPFADLITVGQESLAQLTGCPDAARAHRLLLEGNCKLLCYLSGQSVRLTNGRSTAVVLVDQPVPEPAAAGALLYALAQDWIPGKGLSGLSHGELYRLAEFIVLYALPPALG